MTAFVRSFVRSLVRSFVPSLRFVTLMLAYSLDGSRPCVWHRA